VRIGTKPHIDAHREIQKREDAPVHAGNQGASDDTVDGDLAV